MSRLVLHERKAPYHIKAGNEDVYLCGCGLSKNKPYCDGTHKTTFSEGDDLYFYDNEGNRVKLSSFYVPDK
jgi:CDGSH-type Zn-finger protein